VSGHTPWSEIKHKKDYGLIEVDEKLLAEMVLHGCAVVGEDGVAELTVEFSKWLNAWLATQIDKHQCPTCLSPEKWPLRPFGGSRCKDAWHGRET